MTSAIILAAGTGTRMKAWTADRPKTLLPVRGRLILHSQLDAYERIGITRLAIVAGHHRQKVVEASRPYHARVFVNERYEQTGMLESLYAAREMLDEDALVSYGDVYVTPGGIRALWEGRRGDITVGVDASRLSKLVQNPAGAGLEPGSGLRKGPTLVSLDGDRVTDIGKDVASPDGVYVGVAWFSRRAAAVVDHTIAELITSGAVAAHPSPSYLVRRLIGQGLDVRSAAIAPADYAEIDNPGDLLLAHGLDPTRVKAVFFDADGVIYDRTDETMAPLLDFFRDHGCPVSRARFEAAYASLKLRVFQGTLDKSELLGRTLRVLGVEDRIPDADEFLERFRAAYSQVHVFDEILPLFGRLRARGIEIVVLTDTFSTARDKMAWFARHGLARLVSRVLASSETGLTKFQAACFTSALASAGVTKDEAVFVGHQAYEMAGARSAGVLAVSTVEGVGEDVFVRSPMQILDLLSAD